MRIGYRARQFWYAIQSKPDERALALAQELLPPPLLALFEQQQASEQAHCLRILTQLLEQGEDQPDLLAAALLHDAGKSRYPLRVWERVLVVLGRALFPRQAQSWGRGEARGWRRAFVVAEQHPAWGAEMASRAGASPLTTALILRHQQIPPIPAKSEEDRLLLKLQWFDDNN